VLTAAHKAPVIHSATQPHRPPLMPCRPRLLCMSPCPAASPSRKRRAILVIVGLPLCASLGRCAPRCRFPRPICPQDLRANHTIACQRAHDERAVLRSGWQVRSLGRSGVADLVERTCRLARMFADGLRDSGFQVLNDVVLNQVLVSFGDAAATERAMSGQLRLSSKIAPAGQGGPCGKVRPRCGSASHPGPQRRPMSSAASRR
jgi:hypothetical protein